MDGLRQIYYITGVKRIKLPVKSKDSGKGGVKEFISGRLISVKAAKIKLFLCYGRRTGS